MEITKMILTNKSANPQKPLIKLKYIVLHWTANTNKGANAKANRNYFNTFREGNNTSAHYIVDDSNIIQCLEDLHVGYHVGAKKYTTFGQSIREGTVNSPNMYTLGIEMCVNSDGDFNKMYQNTVELVALLLKKHGLTIENITTHNKITGKDCPNFMLTDIELNKFKQEVLMMITPKVSKQGIVTASSLNVRESNSAIAKVVKTIAKDTKVNILEEKDGWYKIGESQWVSAKYVKLVDEKVDVKPVEIKVTPTPMGINYIYKDNKVAEVNPLDMKIIVADKPANKVVARNLCTSGYQTYDAVYENGKKTNRLKSVPLGILVSDGKIISNRQPHVGFGNIKYPAGTLIVHNDTSVEIKSIVNIDNEKNVKFAVSGVSILPKIRMVEEGFCKRKSIDGIVRDFSDVGRLTSRICVGFNSKKNKIMIVAMLSANIGMAQTIMKELGCDYAISEDGGGSTIFVVDGVSFISTARQLYSFLSW
jgi:N-acetylmuramoyl-L-alanine amidase CwlA